MSAVTLTHPARGLMAPGHDPRPCVNKPAQWWDLDNEHNVRAVRYCRNVCPLRKACAASITDEALPKGQIRAGHAFNDYGKRISICTGCDRPRRRVGAADTIVCGCPPKPTADELAAQRQAAREARAAERARQKSASRPLRPVEQMVNQWLPLYEQGLSIKQAAERMGVHHSTLKNALHRARVTGDRRVPYFRAPRKPLAVAA